MTDRLRQSLQRFMSLFRRARLDQEHDAEVAAHLDLATPPILGQAAGTPGPQSDLGAACSDRLKVFS